MKRNINEQRLFPNPDIYEINIGLPVHVEKSIDSLDYSKLGTTQLEQETAKSVITNWVQTLWDGMIFLTQNLEEPDKNNFKINFAQKLSEFVVHLDHGITHSYFVYLGMHKLINADNVQIDENQDKQLQLMALLHDAIQMLPFSMPEKTNGKLAQKNQKNEHAKIIAVLTRMYGEQLGFDLQTIRALSFGLKEHDSTYNKVFYPNDQFDYLSKLLHDSDKLFGTSKETDTQTLVLGMLLRNFEANKGIKGGYLIRTDFSKEYRDKLTYGDRCYSDSLAVIYRELELPMYTNAGNQMAGERRKIALETMHQIYGEIFDQTSSILSNVRIENAQFTVGGMAQNEESVDINSQEDIIQLIESLYTKILVLTEKYHRPGYKQTDARGWKLFIKQDGQTFCIDPSIARFCGKQGGREEFLQELSCAFNTQFPKFQPTN